ncbi:MAG: glycosyltransferase family 4 protein [Alphaproteobacteria bacterium]|nr:glycosyltransferase family 4 protein [Alphaproteobacteria bacterium]
MNGSDQDSPTQPSIMFACSNSILDVSSGVAHSIHTLLVELVARGYRATALQAMIFDAPQGGAHILESAKAHKDKALLRTNLSGVEHLLVRTASTRRLRMTSAEQEVFLKTFRMEIAAFRPDMIITWGNLLLEMTLRREAHAAGIPVIFMLVNDTYKDKQVFEHVTTIVTDSHATANLYKDRLGLECHPVGKLIFRPSVVHPAHSPDFITFITPNLEKGVNLFAPLARLAAQECPEIKFLVVQGRGDWEQALQLFRYSPDDFPNVKVMDAVTDIRPVYGRTRALLMPSMCHESGGRVVAEALMNSIPVLASNSGGIPEMLGQGGVLFDLPDAVRENRRVPTSEQVVRPWLDEIKRIWHDQPYYADLCARAENASEKHDLQRNVSRFLKAVSTA